MGSFRFRMVSSFLVGSLALTGVMTPSSKPDASAARSHSGSEYAGRVSELRAAAKTTQPTLSRRGRRVYSGRPTATTLSSNWSGYAGRSATALQGAHGSWTVPTVAATTRSVLYSSSWVGIDGDGNSWLIQTGTGQDNSSARTSYYPWFELITPTDPAPETPIAAVVAPGDAMVANIEKISPGVWQMYLADSTQNWYFQQDFAYGGPGTSAEWVEEAPTVGSRQSAPADWGTVRFARTAIDQGGTWYTTAMTSNNAVDLVGPGGDIIAAPGPISPPGADGQSFADVFGAPSPPPRITHPSPPTGVTERSGHRAIRLRWTAPRSTGGAAVARYIVDEYRGRHLFRVLHSTSTAITAGNLSHSWRYSFTVVAWNGSYASVASARTAPLRPRK